MYNYNMLSWINHMKESNILHRMFSTNTNVIGFIGLGNMGLPMAKNLFLNTDHQMLLYDINYQNTTISQIFTECKEPINKAKIAKNVKQVAQSSSIIITMLPNNEAAQAVYCNDDGLLINACPNTLLIDSSTIAPHLAQEFFEKAKKRRIEFIDAPVSGGVGGAEKATLSFMIGGEKESFERSKRILSYMGKNFMYCGGPGLGQVAKICNNLLLAISMIGTSEVLHLGKKLGMDPALLTSVINSSSGRCWSSEIYNPVPDIMPNVPSSKQYQGGFGVKLMCKDLDLALNSATQAKANVPLGSLTRQLYQLMSCHQDYYDKDFSVIYKFLDHQAKNNI